MNVVIIRYNAGNVRSVDYALRRLGVEAVISSESEVIRNADKVILPGVGEAASAMRYFRENEMDKLIRSLAQPVLGICLGMQLMCLNSEENDTECLGIFPVPVRKFPDALKVPQIGWNQIEGQGPLFSRLGDSPYMYFVHSYFAAITAETIAKTNYGFDYSSALRKDNFYGVQFHPERSGTDGERIIKNFLEL